MLEQLRLLTKLETHTRKLLQIVLIGQPELRCELLTQPALEQGPARGGALSPGCAGRQPNARSTSLARGRSHTGRRPAPLDARALKAIARLERRCPGASIPLCGRACWGLRAQPGAGGPQGSKPRRRFWHGTHAQSLRCDGLAGRPGFAAGIGIGRAWVVAARFAHQPGGPQRTISPPAVQASPLPVPPPPPVPQRPCNRGEILATATELPPCAGCLQLWDRSQTARLTLPKRSGPCNATVRGISPYRSCASSIALVYSPCRQAMAPSATPCCRAWTPSKPS